MTKLYNATIRAAIGLSVAICLFCGIIAGQLYFDRQARILRHEKASFQTCPIEQAKARQWLI